MKIEEIYPTALEKLSAEVRRNNTACQNAIADGDIDTARGAALSLEITAIRLRECMDQLAQAEADAGRSES